jgi:hypothetical protein
VVLASLTDLFPGPDWPQLAGYMISRTLEHGVRRAEEMREVARTVEEAGVSPWMSRATAERQDWAPQFKAALNQDDLKAMLDSIRAEMEPLPIEPSENEIDAAARVLDSAGRFHHWWPESMPTYDKTDAVGRDEFGGIVEQMLLAAARTRGNKSS